MEYRPFLSIDLETTGIDDRSEILQIGCVLADGTFDTSNFKTLNIGIKYPFYKHAEPYAVWLNRKFFEKMFADGDRSRTNNENPESLTSDSSSISFMPPHQAAGCFLKMIGKAHTLTSEHDALRESHKSGRVMLAGQNASVFDKPKLEIFLKRFSEGEFLNPKYPESKEEEKFRVKALKKYNELIYFKTLDSGQIWFGDFGYLPSLDEVNSITGRTGVTHDALDDAWDSVYSILHKLEEEKEMRESRESNEGLCS
jgi:hypothetical protein